MDRAGKAAEEHQSDLAVHRHFSFEIPTKEVQSRLTTENAQHSASNRFPSFANMADANNNEDQAAQATQAARIRDYGVITDEAYNLITQGVTEDGVLIPPTLVDADYAAKQTTQQMVPMKRPPARRTVPVRPPQRTLGIYVQDPNVVDMVLKEVLPEGHHFTFNEPENTYAISIVTKVTKRMEEAVIERAARQRDRDGKANMGGKKGEQEHFFDVIEEEIQALALEADVGVSQTHKGKQHRMLWRVWTGYSTSTLENVALREILTIYCQIRLGYTRVDADEYKAMVAACNRWYFRNNPGQTIPTAEHWTLPIIHVMNWHLRINYPQFRPLVFARSSDKHAALQAVRDLTSVRHTHEERDGKRPRLEEPYKTACLPLDIRNFRAFLGDVHGAGNDGDDGDGGDDDDSRGGGPKGPKKGDHPPDSDKDKKPAARRGRRSTRGSKSSAGIQVATC